MKLIITTYLLLYTESLSENIILGESERGNDVNFVGVGVDGNTVQFIRVFYC